MVGNMFRYVVFFGFVFLPAVTLAANRADLEKDLRNALERSLKDKPSIVLPKYVKGQCGRLCSNTTPLYVKSIVVEYSSPPPDKISQYIQKTAQSFKNKHVRIKDLAKLVDTIEQGVVALGYPMVRVVLPVQQLTAKGARVKISVISGYVEDIKIAVLTKDKASQIKKVIHRYMDPLKPLKYLSSVDINRQLLLLRNSYGVYSRIFLSKGRENGAFDINVRSSFKGSGNILVLNNALSKDYGKNSAQYAHVENFIEGGIPQQLEFFAIGSLKQSPTYYRSVSAKYKRVLDNNSTVGLTASASRTLTFAKNGYSVKGDSRTVGVTYTYPYLLNFSKDWRLGGGFFVQKDTLKNTNTGQWQHKDSISEFRLFSKYKYTGPIYNYTLDVTASKMLPVFSAKATEVNSVASSRLGASVESVVLSVDYVLNTSISTSKNKKVDNTLYISGQTTGSDALLSSKRFYLAGSNKIKGLGSNNISGDEGFVLHNRIDFSSVSLNYNKLAFIPSVSFAYGKVFNIKPTKEEDKNSMAASLTFGVKVPLEKFTVNVDYSFVKWKKTTVEGYKSDKYLGLSVDTTF